MAWYQPDRIWFDDTTGNLIFQYNVPLSPEEYDAISNPYDRYEVVAATGLSATKIGTHHFGSWDETIKEAHDQRCDGQPPA